MMADFTYKDARKAACEIADLRMALRQIAGEHPNIQSGWQADCARLALAAGKTYEHSPTTPVHGVTISMEDALAIDEYLSQGVPLPHVLSLRAAIEKAKSSAK